jgi:hypothetical protein
MRVRNIRFLARTRSMLKKLKAAGQRAKHIAWMQWVAFVRIATTRSCQVQTLANFGGETFQSWCDPRPTKWNQFTNAWHLKLRNFAIRLQAFLIFHTKGNTGTSLCSNFVLKPRKHRLGTERTTQITASYFIPWPDSKRYWNRGVRWAAWLFFDKAAIR